MSVYILGYCRCFHFEVTSNTCNRLCPYYIEDINKSCNWLERRENNERLFIKNPTPLPATALYQEGKKHDSNKLRFDLIPPECLEELAKVLTYGANKYFPDNWKKVEPFKERYYSALMRHLELWRKGEDVDQESNLNHLSHVLANVVFLLWGDLNFNSNLINTVLPTNCDFCSKKLVMKFDHNEITGHCESCKMDYVADGLGKYICTQTKL